VHTFLWPANLLSDILGYHGGRQGKGMAGVAGWRQKFHWNMLIDTSIHSFQQSLVDGGFAAARKKWGASHVRG